MSQVVCLSSTNVLGYPEGGGHLWAYMNWVLSFKAMGCEVYWLEVVGARGNTVWVNDQLTKLRSRLEPYGLANRICLCTEEGEDIPGLEGEGLISFEEAASADLLFNMRYAMTSSVVKKFRRSAFVDIDPGLLQIWVQQGQIKIAPHDVYLTIGASVGALGSKIPSLGLDWICIPPVIALDWWPVSSAPEDAALTTVTHWYAGEWVDYPGGSYSNNKRDGFSPFEKVPSLVSVPMELALNIGDDEFEAERLRDFGWRVRKSFDVSSTPWEYQRYIQGSFGEFSCAKPSYVRLDTGWISDRSICYLASGKPVIVQYTGENRQLPDFCGMFRFKTPQEAVHAINIISRDYAFHSEMARTLANDFFGCHSIMPSLFNILFQ